MRKFILMTIFFLIGCSSQPSDDSSTRSYTIIQGGIMTESIGQDGDRLQGEIYTDYTSDEGSFIMRSTVDDSD